MKPMKKDKGFTIVELVIVIAVVAILSAVLIPTFTGLIDSAKRSTDEQLVAQVNHMLIADQSHFDFNNASSPANIKNKIEKEYGVTLETKSKDVYIFYNNISHLVELGSITEDGEYIKVYPENDQKAIEFAAADNQGLLYAKPMLMAANAPETQEEREALLTSIYSPEALFKNRCLIAGKSADGLADAISLLRNPKSVADVTEALAAIEDNKKIPAAVKSLYKAFAENTAFVSKDADGAVIVFTLHDKTGVRNVTFSQEIDTLNADILEKLNAVSPKLVDFPESIKTVTVDETFKTQLKAMTDSKVIVVVNNTVLNQMKNNGVTEDILSTLVKETERDKYTKQTTLTVKDGSGNVIHTAVPAEVFLDKVTFDTGAVVNPVVFDSLNDDEPENGISANHFKGISFTQNGNAVILERQTTGTSNCFVFSVGEGTLIDVSELEKGENGDYIIYAKYETVPAEASVVPILGIDPDSGDFIYSEDWSDIRYYCTLNDALDYAYYCKGPDAIIVTSENGEISRDSVLASNDCLTFPADDLIYNGAQIRDFTVSPFDYNGLDLKWVTDSNNSPTLARNIKVNGTLYINGKLYNGGRHFAGISATRSGFISGNYCKINLQNDGQLIIGNDGLLANYGVISGSHDKTQVVVKDGGRINGIVMTDSFNGGSHTFALAGQSFPFNTYSMDGLYVQTKFEDESVFNGQLLFTAGGMTISVSMNIIGPAGTQSVFEMQNGASAIYHHHYNGENPINKTVSMGRTEVILEKGDVKIGQLKVEMPEAAYTIFSLFGMAPSSVSMLDTSVTDLPISGNFDITIADGAKLTVATSKPNAKKQVGIKMMPGARMTVNGELVIDNSAFTVYEWANNYNSYKNIDEFRDANKGKTVNGYYQYLDGGGTSLTHDKYSSDAVLTVNGKIIFKGTCGFSGNIQSKGGKNTVIDETQGKVNYNHTMCEYVYHKVGEKKVLWKKITIVEPKQVFAHATKDGKSHFNEQELGN